MASSITIEQLSAAVALAEKCAVRPIKHHGQDCYSTPVTPEGLTHTKRFLEQTGDGVADVTFEVPQDYRVVAMMMRAGIKVTVST